MPKKIISLDELSRFKSDYDNALETGQIIPSKSLVAQEIEPISPESGDTQETPFALQGTGTANGTSSVDTGTVGKHIQKQGSVYCVNQQIINGNFANDTGWTTTGTLSVSNNVATWTPNALQSQLYHSASIVLNHTYLLKCKIKLTSSTNQVYLRFKGQNLIATQNSTSSQELIATYKPTSGTTSTSIGLIDNRSSGWDAIQVENFQLIDLTQWFNGNIPQDLLDHPEHWGLYQTYGEYIAYNTGTLVSGNGKYLVCNGRNIWDEEWELGNINTTTGVKYGDGSRIRSKNYFRVIPNTYYFGLDTTNNKNIMMFFYDKDFNYIGNSIWFGSNNNTTPNVIRTPSNANWALFIMGSAYGTTYKNDITISIYYSGEDYSQYYPYEQPKVYDTGDEELLSTGVKLSVSGERTDVYDYKEPSGLITRRVGKVDLGTLSYQYNSNGYFTTTISDGFRTPTNNAICSKYGILDFNTGFGSNDKVIKWLGYDAVCIKDTTAGTDPSQFKTAMSGVYFYYELSTPTTEQGTPFSENIEINDFGTMGWYSSYTDSNTNTLVSVPQGCKIFYPAWHVGFIDTLGQRADIDWNANNVVSQTELGVVDTKHDNLYAIIQENIGGTLRHQLADKASIDFLNTKWVDLGTLSWSYISGSGGPRMITTINNAKSTQSGSIANIVCPLYKTSTANDIYNSAGDNLIALNTNVLWIYSSTMGTDATVFKNAMKGVLLAYEKA